MMEAPARIGQYELEELLGGGVAHVYRARDAIVGRTVAVKILTDAGCADQEVRRRFLAEARMLRDLAHDNVPSVYDFGEDQRGHPYMVMEFLRGEDLGHAIRGHHTGGMKDKLRIALQVARALEYIHSRKMVHGDVTPENVHLGDAGVVKLIGFGQAVAVPDGTDLYAFGALLSELTNGVKPIDEPLNEAMRAVRALVARCTSKNPAEQPQGFAPVRAELERILGDAPTPALRIVARRAESPPKPWRAAWLIPAILAAAAVLAVVGRFALGRRTAPPPPARPALAKTFLSPAGDMVLAPAGPFLSGPDRESITLAAFYIDKTEVTNAAYAAFCAAKGHPLPGGFTTDQPDYPVVNVSFLDAQAFAQWAKKRLPTAPEWEKAARGERGQAFPWGDQPDRTRAAVGLPALVPAKAFENAASPYGALQMVGNVWELVEQAGAPSPAAIADFTEMMRRRGMKPPAFGEPWCAIRGGSFNEKDLSPDLVWDSTTVPVRWKDFNIGFRCAKDAPQ